MGRSKLQVADFIQKLFVAGSCIAELFKDLGNPDLIESSPYLPHWYMYTSIWWNLRVLSVLQRPEVVDIGVNTI